MMRASILVLGFVMLVPATASAAGEACFRDTECVGAELCVGGTCSTADPSVQACTTEDDCSEGGAECVDGFCKREGVVCSNPAGMCWVEDGSGRCECGNGEGSAWTDGFNPDDPPEPQTDAELQLACIDDLVESCGEDAPALPDSCVDEVLTECEAFVDHEGALLEACGEEVADVSIGRVGQCCDTFDDEANAAYRECVLAIEVVSCGDAFAACEDGGGVGTDEDLEGAQDGEGEDDGGTKAGCRLSDAPSPWALIALLGLSAWRIRSRRRP